MPNGYLISVASKLMEQMGKIYGTNRRDYVPSVKNHSPPDTTERQL
jgi:hypothetical protein